LYELIERIGSEQTKKEWTNYEERSKKATAKQFKIKFIQDIKADPYLKNLGASSDNTKLFLKQDILNYLEQKVGLGKRNKGGFVSAFKNASYTRQEYKGNKPSLPMKETRHFQTINFYLNRIKCIE